MNEMGLIVEQFVFFFLCFFLGIFLDEFALESMEAIVVSR